MVTHPISRALGLCLLPRSRRHRFLAGLSSHETRIRERDISVRGHGLSETLNEKGAEGSEEEGEGGRREHVRGKGTGKRRIFDP